MGKNAECAWHKSQPVGEVRSKKKYGNQAILWIAHRAFYKTDVFVLMPFAEDLKPVYQDHIVQLAKSLNLKAVRGDYFFSAHSIMSDIWNAIYDARLIIADCTNRNPNVFYEIGVAHAIGQKVILITQNKDDVPFDLRHLRFIDYEYTPRGMREFESRLKQTIQTELLI